MSEIRRAIKKLADTRDEIYTIVAKVDSVNEEALSCDVTPVNGDAPILNVRLKADVIEGGLVLFPEVGSMVLVGFLNKTTGFVAQCSSVSKVHLNCDEIVFNNGENSLVIWSKLKTELEKTNEVLKAVTDTLKNWTPVPNDGGAALQLAAMAALVGKVQGNFENLEDSKIKH